MASLPLWSGQPKQGDVILGKYQVDGVVGAGAMGVVLGARHLELDEEVAIKFLRPELMSDPTSCRDFSARPVQPCESRASTSCA